MNTCATRRCVSASFGLISGAPQNHAGPFQLRPQLPKVLTKGRSVKCDSVAEHEESPLGMEY
jgi:hypothetical protein